MPKVKTELGWNCDSDYLVDTEGQLIGTDKIKNNYFKYNNTPAIVIKIKRKGGFNSIALVSTRQDAVFLEPLYLSFVDGKATINGVTWYYGSPLYGVDNDNDPSPDLKWLNEESPIDAVPLQYIIEDILAKANVTMEEK